MDISVFYCAYLTSKVYGRRWEEREGGRKEDDEADNVANESNTPQKSEERILYDKT